MTVEISHIRGRRAGQFLCVLLVLALLVAPIRYARGQESSDAQTSETSAEVAPAESPPAESAPAEVAAAEKPGRLEPVFPRENPNVVFVEGEDALSTNFNSQPTLNYSVSGKRALQLSSVSDLQGEGVYYADFVFYVPATGEYELWYGGTPAGPLDELYPSFFSPFRYRLDEGEPVAVYREDIVVNEIYAPSFYWNRLRPVALQQGVHRLRVEVREKRRYDNRYYFYLDCFFLVRIEGGERMLGEPLPTLFPRDLASTAIDHPFRSIDDYLVIVNQATERSQKIGRQIELATIYSMVGDYVNALRYLSRAAVLAPDDPEILLLQAKNQIWKGDVGEGLATYRRLLDATPERADLWTEAGKIAAWTGRYDESAAFLKDGLERFPGDLDLMVNLGLTYLWSSKVTEADRMFRESLQAAGGDLDKLKYLAKVYRINGYPEQALPLYRAAIARFPSDLESYLLLEDAYRALNRSAEAEGVARQVEETFVLSPELERYLATYSVKQGLIDSTIREYEKILASNQDNLELRQLLAQTYFWNGRQREAIEEYLHILMNHTYRAFRELESSSLDLLELLDSSYLLARAGGSVPESGRAVRAGLDTRRKEYERVAAALRKTEESVQKATGGAEGASEQLQAELASRQSALDDQDQLAASAIDAATLETTRLEGALEQYKGLQERLGRLTESEAEAQRLFKDEIKPSRWTWNRGETMGEATAQAGQGLVIAQYVLGKIAQVERRFPAAAQVYARLGDAEAAYTYGRGQSAMWEGKLAVDEYLSLLTALPPESVPYLPALEELAGVLGTPAEAGGGSGGSPLAGGDDVLAALDAASSRIDELLQQVDAMRKGLPREQRTAHRLLSDRMVRSFYRLQASTARLRNELGDYYLKAGDRENAIRQYRYVLAVDPGNIDAIYRLGTTSSLAGDWSGALGYYERVHAADPYYENVINVHNRIAEEHADALATTATYSADSTRMSWTGSGLYTLPLVSFLGLQLGYEAGSYRSVEQLVNPSGPPYPVPHHIAYSSQAASLGIPLSIYRIGLTITPRVGAGLVLNSQYFTGDPGTGSSSFHMGDIFDPDFGAFTPLSLLRVNSAHPFAAVDLDLAVPNALRVQASARYGTYAQTVAQPKSPRSALTGFLGISPVLSFLKVPVLRDVYLRSYGELAYLPASGASRPNAVGLFAQDLVIPFRFSGAISPTLSVEGALYYADSVDEQPVYEYYAPHSALTVKGGLSGSLSFALRNGDRLTYWLHAAGGYAESVDAASGDTVRTALIEASSRWSYARRGATVSVVATGSTAIEGDALSYWSMSMGLEVSTKMPRLLSPR